MIVLNGGSSSGKTSIARSLQTLLPWLAFSIDDFVDALPPGVFSVGPGGAVEIGEEFHRLEAAWRAGVAATARAGAGVIVDDVFLSGAGSQERWRAALGDLPVLWVGVHCSPSVAAAREAGRPDRNAGMAASQALSVHDGVFYDLTVDTTCSSAEECARAIARRWRSS